MAPSRPAGMSRRASSRRAEEGAVEHDVDHRAPGVGAHVLGRHREVARRVVDQHVDRAEGGLDAVEGGGDRVGVADVARRGPCLRPGGLDGGHPGRPVLLVAAEDRHRGAQPTELGGDGLAEAGAAAGHDHHGAVIGAGHQGGGADRRRWTEARPRARALPWTRRCGRGVGAAGWVVLAHGR